MQYQRTLEHRLVRLAQRFPAVVVTGARQTGKTTLLRKVFPDHRYLSLDVPLLAAQADENPDQFLKSHKGCLLIDEVQYAPGLFRYLKLIIDQDRSQHGRFILTGSQKFSLMREISDSLAGRVAVAELETLSLSEIGAVADSYRTSHSDIAMLARGFFPQLWKDLELMSLDFYGSYLATYMERDVRQLVNVGSLRNFDRFLRACAVRSGQLLNKTEISKEVGVSQVTVNQWLSVLVASNQVTLLEPYFANIGKRLVKSPKLFFHDSGLLCFLLGLGPQSLADSPMVGQIWETFVFSELRKLAQQAPQAQISFFGDKTREVDFLIDVGGKVSLFEVKWSELPHKKWASSLSETADILRRDIRSEFLVCRVAAPTQVSDRVTAVDGFKLGECDLGLTEEVY